VVYLKNNPRAKNCYAPVRRLRVGFLLPTPSEQGVTMLVRKVRGQDKVGKIILLAAEIAVVRKMGIPVEKYIEARLVQIAKKRGWKWYFNKEKNDRTL
jgi:hypothetical protein